VNVKPTVIAVISTKDLRSFFATPLAYLVGVPYTVLMGWYFYSSLVDTRSGELQTYFSGLHFLLLLTAPLLTMRTIAEERRAGALEMVFVRPVRELEITFGKWIAAVAILIILSYPLVPFLGVVLHLADPDVGILLAQLLGTGLLAALLVAVGIAASAAVESQLVAAFSAFAVAMVQWFADAGAGGIPNWVLRLAALRPRLVSFRYGVVSAEDGLFFVAWTLAWLFVANLLLTVARRR